jgi:hypothetical protein
MSFTVVPLHNLNLPTDSRAEFGSGFILQEVPEWVKKDPMLDHLSYPDRHSILVSKHALVSEYEAASIGEPDPLWAGKEPKSIQERKFEAAILANVVLWLVQPSIVCFTVVLHAVSWSLLGQPEKQPLIQQIDRQNPLFCHRRDIENRISADQAVEAGRLHGLLFSIPRNNPVWTAMRLLWAALTMYPEDLRYSLFWVGLEALFGPDDNSGEITYKLSQRIAFFISDTTDAARGTFRKAQHCYRMRSRIVHGRWDGDPKMDAVMADTEDIVRSVFLRLLNEPELLLTFISKQRDKFLEDLVFSRGRSAH